MSETFKERMKRMRLRAGFASQQDAADAIGCKRGTIGMWEAPSSPVDSVGGEYFNAVVRAYKVRPDYLNSGKGDDGYPWNQDQQPAPLQESHSLTLEPEILSETIKALRERNPKKDWLTFIEEEPDRFIRAYTLYAEKTTESLSPEEQRKLGMKLADLTPQGAMDNERYQEVPAQGAIERRMGDRRRGKTPT